MSFIVAAKEVTESCVSVGDALAIKEIKPSGTLGYRFIKRLFDLVFSLLMSVLLLIPIAIVCALISLESPGSPMYTQERVGKGGKTIKIFKLRSMSPTLAMYRSTLALSSYISGKLSARLTMILALPGSVSLFASAPSMRCLSLSMCSTVICPLLDLAPLRGMS